MNGLITACWLANTAAMVRNILVFDYDCQKFKQSFTTYDLRKELGTLVLTCIQYQHGYDGVYERV